MTFNWIRREFKVNFPNVCDIFRIVLFSNREDVNKQLDNIQGDLDSLKELFQADTDYSLDANALFGVSELTENLDAFSLCHIPSWGKSFQSDQ